MFRITLHFGFLLNLNKFRSPVRVNKYIQFLTVAMQVLISVDKT